MLSSRISLVAHSLSDLTIIEEDQTEKKFGIREKLCYLQKLITIEPLLCCYLVADVISGPALNNLQLEMSCKANSNFNASVCKSVVKATHGENNFTSENSIVQQHISDMLSWCIPLQSVIPVILLLFFGSYSDRHQIRKPFLLLPVLGEIITTFFYIICTMFMHTWPVMSIGIVYTISSFFGSTPMITMAAFAYIADISTQEMRIVRMSVIQICLSVCVPIALTFSGVLFDRIGYIPTLLLSFFLYTLAFLYGIFMINEPKESKQNGSLKVLISDVVNPQHVLETVNLLRKSKGAQKINILFILTIVFILALVIGGEDSVFFYFTQHAYGWDYSHYTIFLAVWTVINSMGLAVGAFVLSRIFHLDDLLMIIISFIGKIVANIIFITVKSAWGLYIGLFAGILQDVGSAGVRSQSTKYVSEDDTAKSQSLLSIVEAIAYAVAAEIYHQGVYTHTRDTFIQAFFYVGIALFAFAIIILMWKYLSERKQLLSEKTKARLENELKLTRREEKSY